MSDVAEVVCGTNYKDVVVTLKDELGTAINLTGATVKLQGTSDDGHKLPAVDQAGTVDSPATAGIARFADVGTYVPEAPLRRIGLKKARYDFRVRASLAGSELDFGPEFQIDYAVPPIPAA